MSKLRILMIAPTPYFSDRGCHVRIFEEAKALRNLGHEVRICTYHLGRDMGEIQTCRIPHVPWYRKRSAGPSWHKLYLDVFLFFKTLQAARNFSPHILHAHLHEGAFVGALLKKFVRLPIVFDCQGSLTGELEDHGFAKQGSALNRLFRIIERQINLAADHIVTSSTPTAEMLHKEFNILPSRVTPVCDGVDVADFSPGPASRELKSRLGLPNGSQIVLFLGAMTSYQGLDLLLEAIKILSLRGTRLHFLLMGYPEETYQRRAKEMGIARLVTFTGKVEYGRAAEFLRLGDLAVSPKLSKTEANGKLFNYMACGLPSVVFDTPVNREILGEQGVYAKFGDAEDLADQMELLANDDKRLSDIACRVREKAVRDYSWHEVAHRMNLVYQNLLR